MAMADRLVSDGYRDVGYNYVNIDDCWPLKKRALNGSLVANPERFPQGIKWLAKYMHDRKLKLGIYGDFGNYTCGGYPGSEYHLKMDADTFAEWDIDSLKLDGCYSKVDVMNAGYTAMGNYLNETGRPMAYACSWPDYQRSANYPIDWPLIEKTCNLWRLYDDIQDSWESVLGIITYWGNNQSTIQPLAGPGHWNDPDQLIIGDFSLSPTESKTQMSFWCIWAAPLLMSNDLRTIQPWQRSILLNSEAIAVNQDPLGIQGLMVQKTTNTQVWKKLLHDGSTAVLFFYSGSSGTPAEISVDLAKLGIHGRVSIRDLWTHESVGTASVSYTAYVDPHGVSFLKMTPI